MEEDDLDVLEWAESLKKAQQAERERGDNGGEGFLSDSSADDSTSGCGGGEADPEARRCRMTTLEEVLAPYGPLRALSHAPSHAKGKKRDHRKGKGKSPASVASTSGTASTSGASTSGENGGENAGEEEEEEEVLYDAEAIEENLFYKAMTTTYAHIHNHATAKQYTLAIPVEESLRGYVPNERRMMMHVLMPATSEHEYITMDRRRVEYDASGKALVTGSNFDDPRSIPILHKETFYNSDFEPFSVLLIQEPLEGGLSFLFATDDEYGTDDERSALGSPRLQGDRVTLADFPETHTYPAYMSLMTRIANEALVGAIIPALCDFNQTPINPQNKHAYTVARLKTLTDATMSHLEATNTVFQDKMAESPAYALHFQVAVESVVLGGVNTHLFAVLCAYHARSDGTVAAGMESLASLSLGEMDIRDSLAGADLSSASAILPYLAECRTPLEKKMVVRATLLAIQEAVEPFMEADDPLSADDTLWLLVYVLVASRIPHVYAHVVHMREFTLYTSSLHELTYYVATLDAAVSFIMSKGESALSSQQQQQRRRRARSMGSSSSSAASSVAASSVGEAAFSPSRISSARSSTSTFSRDEVDEEVNLSQEFDLDPDRRQA